MKKDAQGIYNFDTLVVEPRIAIVGGEKVDVSTIPVAVSLAFAKLADRTKEEILEIATTDPEGEMRRMFELVSDVCVVSNPKITPEFLMKHLDYKKFNVFMKFVLQPMTDKAAEFSEGDEGNEETGETSSG